MSKERPWSFFDPEIAHKRTFPGKEACMAAAQGVANQTHYAVLVERREWSKRLQMWVDRPFVVRPQE
jgi:hypothetical protein